MLKTRLGRRGFLGLLGAALSTPLAAKATETLKGMAPHMHDHGPPPKAERIASNAVTADKIAANALTMDKIAPSVLASGDDGSRFWVLLTDGSRLSGSRESVVFTSKDLDIIVATLPNKKVRVRKGQLTPGVTIPFQYIPETYLS